MNILGIESSCDETAAAVVADGARILSNEIASQVEIHARYGGVVPEVASRQHILSIIPVVQQAMEKAGLGWADLGAIAVTRGPGLAGSLLVGVNAAKALAFARGLPLIGVNHMEGHIYANWLLGVPVRFPALCLVVSGGHSDLILMRGHGDYMLVGRTRDDAAGEAFDKAARILGLGYPGGPAVERAAADGVASVSLPNASLRDTFDFSFSGVKTSLVRLVSQGGVALDDAASDGRPSRNDAAASFQEAVVEALVSRTVEAAREQGVRQVLLAGGVAANRLLRQRLQERSPYPVLVPPLVLCTDNAAMVAACGYYRFQAGKIDGWDLDVVPALSLV